MRNIIFPVLLAAVFFLWACDNSDSTVPDGDVDPDREMEYADGDETFDADETADGDEMLDADDTADGDETLDADDTAESDEAPETDEIADSDETPDGEETIDGDQDESSVPQNHGFSGFSSAGGVSASSQYRMMFRFAPAALTMQSQNQNLRLQLTVVPAAGK